MMTPHSTTHLLLAHIARLESELAAAHTDAAYGCLTRAGLERWWHQDRPAGELAVLFGDIDGMHALNAQIGYSAVDARIRAAIAAVPIRCGDVLAAGRWYSGDELVWVCPLRDAGGLLGRIAAAFAAQGMTITIRCESSAYGLAGAVERASEQVRVAKLQRGEGR